jgi:hypothetical protein
MTSHFNDLGRIYSAAQNGTPAAKQLAIWLADLCIHDADLKELGWTYVNWRNTFGGTVRPATEFNLKFAYLEECHRHLDHGQWHLRVFDLRTQQLIDLARKAIVDNDLALNIRDHAKKFPEIVHLLENLGYKKDPQYSSIMVKPKTSHISLTKPSAGANPA